MAPSILRQESIKAGASAQTKSKEVMVEFKMLRSKAMRVKVQKAKVKRQGQVHKEGEHLV